MEFGERLASPSSAPSSLHMASSSASSSPAPSQTPSAMCSSPAHKPAPSSPLTTSGNLLQIMGGERLNKSGSSTGSPSVSRPAFGLYTSSPGRAEFGGLGSLGLSALAANQQFGTFPDWWWPSEAHTRGGTAFFPPLMGLHPVFASTFASHDPAHLQSRTSGVTGAVNGRSASSPTGNSAVSTGSFPTKRTTEKTKAGSRKQKSSQDMHQLPQKTIQKLKEKKPNKRPLETCSMSGSQSGSLSDSSSDVEESSSDPDGMDDDEEEDNDEDEDDQSIDSEDSDSEKERREKRKVKRLTQNTSESKKKRPFPADGNATQGCRRDRAPLTSSYRLQSSSRPAGPSRTAARLLQSSREDKGQQHISVIQATGLATSNSPLGQSHKEASRSSPNAIFFSNSPKRSSSSPKPLALCSPSKPLSLCSPPKPLTLSSLPKPPTTKHTPKFLMPSPNHMELFEGIRDNGSLLDGRSLHLNSLKLKQPIHSKESMKQAFPLPLKSQSCNDTNLFLSHHLPNEVINGAIQEAPLALITNPRSQSSTSGNKPLVAATSPLGPMPINLSTSAKERSGSSPSPLKSSASAGAPTPRKSSTPLHAGRSLSQANPSSPHVDLFRSSESDIHSSKDSDDSLGDDHDDDGDEDEDDIEDEESGSSSSESDSNLESDSDVSEDDSKEHVETEADSDAERTPVKTAKASSSSQKSLTSVSADSSLLNQQTIKPLGLPTSLLLTPTMTSSETLGSHSNLSPSSTSATLPGSGRRKRVTDERVLRLPLEFGWQRQTRIRAVAGRLQGEVAYFAPCGKKLRQYPDVTKYLTRHGITGISRDNFSFSTKIKVGDFYEAREGDEGLQWVMLAEEEITPSIIAMDGRRSRCTKSEHQPAGDGSGTSQGKSNPNMGENNFQNVSHAKLLRKLEAQEIARQAALIKMTKKLEKQAMAQAAKEARKQQAIMAAEEKRKKREQMKIIKQQEKIRRIQQIRLEKELRAQQILEAKRKKKEDAANAKILETEKRNKEKEMRRLHTLIAKHQELERHRLDMERERHRQHMMLMKAVEARKKAEERERLKREKEDEKRLNKERKLELRRLELEKAKEMKKLTEDMCLADQKPLPELSRIPGLVLPAHTFSDCLVVLQFLHNFGKVLKLDINAHMLRLNDLQEGLLNIGEGLGKVQDLLVSLLSAAVCDPGLPAGHKSKTALGDHLTNVKINRDIASEILHIYMNAHCGQTELAALALSLRTKAFLAHSPSQKASMLVFLVNELCCSKAVTSEIEKNIEQMTNLRKDKWLLERKLRKLRREKRGSGVGGEESHTSVVTTANRNKRKRKEADTEEEEEEEEDSEEQGDDDDEEEEESGGKKGKKAEMCEEEDYGAHSVSMEELEKLMEKTYKQLTQIRQKLFDASQTLRSMPIGQDRYRRHYWVLPQCGGIFVEGMGSNEGYEEEEEVEPDRKRQRNDLEVRVKEEQMEESARTTDGDTTTPENQQGKDSLNLFLQKPDSYSKLSKLLEVAKLAQDPPVGSLNSHFAQVPTAASYPSYPASQTATSQQGLTNRTDASAPPPLKNNLWTTCSPQSTLRDDQVCTILTEKSNQWFSLLPRSPCDEASVTSGCSPLAASSPLQTISANPSSSSSSSLSPNPPPTPSSRSPAAISNMQWPVLQHVRSGSHQSRLTPCDMSCTATSPSLPLSGTSLPPVLDLASQHAQGNGNSVFFLANNNLVNKCETPETLSDRPAWAPISAAEVAKTPDYPCCQPIPEEMRCGWWWVSDMGELHRLVKALHSRGIREKALQKQIQKHMEYMTQLCANGKHVIDVAELKKLGVSEETVGSWCVEEQAMEVDISLLQQVEDLEEKVISASLQVKGWMHPEPQSEREDLVYHEHKPFSTSAPNNMGQREISPLELPGTVVRRPNNPLDIAVIRLAELEGNIERSSEDEGAPGMKLWHKALGEVRSSAQLSLCIQQLQKSIAWERSAMKAHCLLCQKGNNEELLLLCDGCDRACHTYCHKPKITTVPDGDWFCPACVTKEPVLSPRSRRQQSRTAGGGKKASEVKRNGKPSALGELIKEEAARSNSAPKKSTKECKRKREDSNPPGSQARPDSDAPCVKKAKPAKDSNTNQLETCRALLVELEAHQDAWPFLTPVNGKTVPGYRKVIKKPMDFSTIREKLTNNQYSNLETFINDVNLVFENCERFNEDDSAIGRAGHSMRGFFDKRWAKLLK